MVGFDSVDARGGKAARRAATGRRYCPHRVLRLPRSVRDPVRIILAAQIQLRRWRRPDQTTTAADSQRRVREIVAARDGLLREALPCVGRAKGVNSPNGRQAPRRRASRSRARRTISANAAGRGFKRRSRRLDRFRDAIGLAAVHERRGG